VTANCPQTWQNSRVSSQAQLATWVVLLLLGSAPVGWLGTGCQVKFWKAFPDQCPGGRPDCAPGALKN